MRMTDKQMRSFLRRAARLTDGKLSRDLRRASNGAYAWAARWESSKNGGNLLARLRRLHFNCPDIDIECEISSLTGSRKTRKQMVKEYITMVAERRGQDAESKAKCTNS
jgi:hypothetical protein